MTGYTLILLMLLAHSVMIKRLGSGQPLSEMDKFYLKAGMGNLRGILMALVMLMAIRLIL